MNYAIASGGGVIRRTDGSWYVGFSCKYDAALSPLAAELYAMFDAISIANDLEIKRIEIETDAESMRKMIDTAGANPHHELAAIIMDVSDVISRFEVAVVTHIPRENNKLAHMLAKHGKEMALGYKTFFMVPEFATEIYEQDKADAAAAALN